MRLTLRSILAPTGTAGAATHVVSTGLQEVLTLLAATVLGNVARSGSVPSGFTGKFRSALTNPTHGGILDFLVWAQGVGATTGLPTLTALLEDERRRKGPLGPLVELRNRFQHPRGEEPADILASIEKLLARSWPELDACGVEDVAGAVHCSAKGESVDLYPLAAWQDRGLALLSELVPPATPRFPVPRPREEEAFRSLWRDLRARDASLDSPTPDEIRDKARRLRAAGSRSTAPPPWWIGDIAGPGVLGALVSCVPKTAPPGAVMIPLTLGSAPIPQTLATALGLAVAPRPPEVLAWAASGPLLVTVDAQGASSRDLLQALYWLADLRDGGSQAPLRVLVARSAEALAADHRALWDRLPERLPSILRKPPGARSDELPALLWPESRPRRFLGMWG